MTESTQTSRRPYRPPIGIPTKGEPRAQATVASIAFHLLVVLLVLAPTLFVSNQLLEYTQRGAGGPGAVGGGGGGAQSFPGRIKYIPEKVDFLKLETQKSAPKLEIIVPKVEEKPPPPPPPPPPTLEPPKVEARDSAPPAARVDSSSVTVGAGRGTGNDGTSGNGPGRGGGEGSGVGTGRGSATGPGSGGGDGTIYPPTVVALPILPLPIPSRVRPYKMVAQFEVDSAGNARLLGFNESRDSGYNRRIREMLMQIRFRPAVTMDGRPVKAIAVVTAEAM
jgi:periplasmic protein TonB